MEDHRLQERESIALISQMIRNTQQNLHRGSGNVFISIGILIATVSLLITTLLWIGMSPYCHFLWFMIPLGVALIIRNKKELVITHLDKMLGQLWQVMQYACIALPLVFTLLIELHLAGDSLRLQGEQLYLLISFIEIIIVSLGMAITGVVLSAPAIKWGGCIGVLIAFGTLSTTAEVATLSFAVWAVTTFITPGILLNRQVKNQTQAC